MGDSNLILTKKYSHLYGNKMIKKKNTTTRMQSVLRNDDGVLKIADAYNMTSRRNQIKNSRSQIIENIITK